MHDGVIIAWQVSAIADGPARRVSCLTHIMLQKDVDKLAVDRRKYCQRIVHPTMVQFIAVSVQFWRAMLTLRCNDQRAVAKFSVQTPEFGWSSRGKCPYFGGILELPYNTHCRIGRKMFHAKTSSELYLPSRIDRTRTCDRQIHDGLTDRQTDRQRAIAGTALWWRRAGQNTANAVTTQILWRSRSCRHWY